MKKSLLVFSVFLFAIAINARAQSLNIHNANLKNFEITENSNASLHFSSLVPSINFKTEIRSDIHFVKLEVDGFGYSTSVGSPALPMLKKLIEIPIHSEFEINILNQTFKEYKLSDYGIDATVLPVQTPPAKNVDIPIDLDLDFNRVIYNKNEFYQFDLVQVNKIGIMRGVQLARLEIAPIQYNPVQQIIRVIDKLEVEIRFIQADVIATKEKKEQLFSPFFEGVYRDVVNYKPIDSKELITVAPITYVIVADPMFEANLQEFVEWKTRKGYRVVEAYTDDPAVGNTSLSIKAFLENLYYFPPFGYNPQTFVLIVGDIAQLPSFDGIYGSHMTDLYYAEYSGDNLPECFIGRFSANNLAQLNAYIDKTLEYEKFEFPNPAFLDSALLISGEDSYAYGQGQINYALDNYFNAEHGIYTHVLQDPYSADTNYTQEILQHINDGISFLNYTGHCGVMGFAGPTLMLGHVSGMVNTHMYPVMVGNCCSSSSFYATCFAEVVTRQTSGGALAYVGASNTTYWNEDFWWAIGFESISPNPVYHPDNLGLFDRWFHENELPLNEWYVTLGQFSAAGNLAVDQSGSTLADYYWEVYHLMGDPSITAYIPQPELPQVLSYEPSIQVGASSLTVETDPWLYIALSKDGVLHGAAISDETGIAELLLFDPLTETGTAEIIITGQNIRPYFGTIEILPAEGPYVLLEAIYVDDSNGNNDGVVDAGEMIYLDASLTNYGAVQATDLIVGVSSTDTNITIFNDPVSWNNIPAGATSDMSGICSFQVHDFCVNGHELEFLLEVTDGTASWESPFIITVHSLISEIEENNTLDELEMIKVYPNPFADYFEVAYNSTGKESVAISLINMIGQEMLKKYIGNQPSGSYKIRLETKELDPGIYFCQVKSGDKLITRKLILSR
jgi:hypothetical protein